MRSLHLCVFLAAALVGSLSVFAAGDPHKITASNGTTGDQFGSAVAISGDTVVVGTELEDGVGASSGAAYVYRWNGSGWTEEGHLIPADSVGGMFFGSAVAISGNTIVVGARFGDGVVADAGAAYVFTRTGSVWSEQAKLMASDGALNDEFGGAVAIDHDTIVVGAKYDDDIGSNSGAAYVYTRAAGVWTQQTKLASSDLASIDQFGRSVVVQGDTIAVGAPTVDGAAGSNLGAVYVFVRTAGVWTEQQKLTASDAAASDRLGDSVNLDGDTIIAGAPLRDTGGSIFSTGAAYVFVRSAGVWVEEAKLAASDPQSSAQVGMSVAIDGDTAIAGAFRYDESGVADQGAAYVFTRLGSTWSEQEKLLAPDGETGDRFGAAVALDDEVAVIGANLDDDTIGSSQGSAYIFERIGVPWGAGPVALEASNGQDNDRFGHAVALDGSRALVGAHRADAPAIYSGAAYLYEETAGAWSDEVILTASDADFGDYFGYSVDLDGDFAVIGARDDSDIADFAGSAYIFQRIAGVWSEQAKIIASDGLIGDAFGDAVSISGDTIIAGAPSESALHAGAAYVFTNVGGVWSEQAKLTPSDGQAGDSFGDAVDIEGDTAIVGAFLDDGAAGDEQGSAYIFVRVGGVWSEQAKLTASDGAGGDDFGRDVAISGDTVIIGAQESDLGGVQRAGAAYVFVRSAGVWTEEAKLVALDGAAFDSFGASVAIESDMVAVVADTDQVEGAGAGSAYIFERADGAWEQRTKLTPSYFWGGAGIQGAVSLSNQRLIAGAPRGGVLGAGEAHLFSSETGVFGVGVSSLSTRLYTAQSGDTLRILYPGFWYEESADYAGLDVDVHSTSEIRQPSGAHWTTADGASIVAETGRPAFYHGGVALPNGATVSMDASATRFGAGGALTLGHGATLHIVSPVVDVEGATEIGVGAALIADGAMRLRAPVDLADALLASGSATTNEESVTVLSDSIIDGDYTNNGSTTIQNGTLTILGTLTDNGAMIGDFATTRSAPGGFFVEDDYEAGASASLTLLNGVAKFGANADIAIDDNTRFNLATSEARMVGVAASTQTYELMSADIGADSDGLDRTLAGNYPLGTFRVGPTPTTVNLVDAHDNDGLGQGAKEALYVSNLIIDAGATLNTNGCVIYYETLTNNGSIDDPANLIQIAACIADITSDGVVDGADLATLLAQWGTPGSADLTGDGAVDGADLAALLAAWGVCP